MKFTCQAIFFLLLLASCDGSRLFEKNEELTGKIWHVDSVKHFSVIIPDATTQYNILVNVRNTSSYPYHNLYLTYTLTDTTLVELSSDLLNNNLFDPVTGKPLGRSGLGDVFDHQFPVLENYQFPDSGRFLITLQQTMRLDSLPEIISVGIRVERTE